MNPFTTSIQVRHNEIDVLGHVNNAVYQQYLEQAAIAHSKRMGFPLEQYQELGGVFVMRRIEIEYLRPAIVNDILAITTWIVEMRGACTIRRYEIRRQGERDLLVTAEALWVWVDAKTLRPRPIPGVLQEAFAQTAICR
ncbi:MAG: acyl-CoA thioesterase [Elainellaceae cyanobacterium]